MIRGLLAVLITGATVAIAPPLHAQRAPNPERDAVVRVIESVAAQIQAGNFGGVDSLYPPRGVHIISGNSVSHGWAEYRDRYLKPELENLQNLTYRYYGVEAVVREAVAWASFRYEMAADAPQGRLETVGRGTAVLEKRDGRWIIVHMHTAGQPKPPGGGQT